MDGKPSIILGLVWTIIMHFHVSVMLLEMTSLHEKAELNKLSTSLKVAKMSGLFNNTDGTNV